MSSLEILNDMIPVSPNDEWKYSVMVRLNTPYTSIKAQNKEFIKVMKKFGEPNVDYTFTNAKLGNIFHVRFKNHELAAWFKLNKMIR